MKDVLAPVGRSAEVVVFAGFVDLVAVIPVDVAVAAVGVGSRGDGNNQVVADAIDNGGIFGDQTISEFHQHFGGTCFAAVQAAHQVVDRLGPVDDFVGLGAAEPARIGQTRQVGPVGFEISDGVLGADEDHDRVAPFVGLSDIDDFDPGRIWRQERGNT